MYYYPHHIGDFIRDTANLDDHQIATYMRMIWSYYDTEKPISLEIEDVAFAMRSNEKTVRLLLRHYFEETPEGWRHKRCDIEIAEYKTKSQKAKIGADARWKNANSMRTQCERNANASILDANQEPVTKNQEPKSIKEPDQNLGATRPDWLNAEDWESFKKHRGTKFTVRAQEMMVKQLSTYRDQGQDPNAMLQRSIANGWKGVFVEKQGANNGTGYISERDKARKRTAKGLYGYDPDAIAGVSTRVD